MSEEERVLRYPSLDTFQSSRCCHIQTVDNYRNDVREASIYGAKHH